MSKLSEVMFGRFMPSGDARMTGGQCAQSDNAVYMGGTETRSNWVRTPFEERKRRFMSCYREINLQFVKTLWLQQCNH